MTVLAVVLAALAAALVAGPWPVRGPRPSGPRSGRFQRLSPLGGAAAVASAGGGMAVLLAGSELVVGLIVLGGATGVLQLWRRGRRCREEEIRRTTVVEVGEALVGELRAGQPVLVALERGRELWPALGPVVAAGRLGADVPAALRRVAALPGAEGLREVAAAWQVSERSGATLSTALAQVVESARARRSAAHLVRSELASAQATARLVALLPLATLAMSVGVGGSPWRFLLTQPAGLSCLATGVALILTGLWWIDRIAVAVTRA
ncbi:MAG: type II secretion system F family protein [Nocardioides sp.]